jgi:protein SCO1
MRYKRFIFQLLITGFIINLQIPVSAQENSSVNKAGITEHLDSIIPLNLMFTDENNQQVELNEIINKPTILVLVFFDCPGICPQILSSVSGVIENISMDLGKDYRVVTVSFNSQDTPEKAKDKKNQFLGTKGKQHSDDCFFLTGDSANIFRLTNSVGYFFEQTGNSFIHPSAIMVLSPQGKITRYLYGTTYLPFDVKMALIEAQKGQARPTINRVLDFCFTYDPAGRRYSLEITKVSGIIILFFSFALLGILIFRSRKKQK